MTLSETGSNNLLISPAVGLPFLVDLSELVQIADRIENQFTELLLR